MKAFAGIVGVLAALLAGAGAAAGQEAGEGGNIALNRPYTMRPRPDYVHCTDPEDRTQLTDGEYTKGYFWTQKSTVGWRNAKPILVIIDLGKVQPIAGVSYNTAAGRAGVAWPSAIYVLAGDDGKAFRHAGNLVPLSAAECGLPPKDYGMHRYRTTKLKTRGRYVALVISGVPYAFVDEIEVFRGEPEWLEAPPTGEPVADIVAYFREREAGGCIERRLVADLHEMRAALKAAAPAGAEKIAAELGAIEKEIPSSLAPSGDRMILPLNALHARLFRAQASLWRAMGRPSMTLWQSRLWDPLSHLEAPPEKSGAKVEVAMMRNEYRAAAFNLSNASDAPVRLRMRIEGLPGGANPGYVTVHQVEWTGTLQGTPVAAALPEAERDGKDWSIAVVPGLTRQVWMTFHPKDVAPGTHEGVITLSDGGTNLKAPIVLKLYPMRFPERPTLHLGGWDYTDVPEGRDITRANRQLVVDHLLSRFVDSPWATPKALTPGEYDADGNMAKEPDTVHFDAWLELWKEARRYCVFAAVSDNFAGSEMGTPLFERKVKAWIAFWAAHMKKRGLRPEQLVVLLVDEPRDEERDARILAWAKPIREASTGIKIWEDPVHKNPAEASLEMMKACDVLCPNRVMFLSGNQAYRDYFVARRDEGAELEFYSCSGPARLLDPYVYHRLQHWSCWRYNAKASHFWAYSDSSGASSWNEYIAKRGAFVPFFLDADSVTPGKHMEAVREGMEDYEYLVMLKETIKRAETRAVVDPAVERAKKLLAEGPEEVCGIKVVSFRWHEERDSTKADAVRVRILEALSDLR